MDDSDVVVVNECANSHEMKYLAVTRPDQHNRFNELHLGVTFNYCPLEPRYWDYGEIHVWSANPGWGW